VSAFAKFGRFSVFWKDLLHTLLQTRFRASFHLGLFDNFVAVLHANADLRALVFVHRMAHAEAAPTSRLVFLHARRRTPQGQQCKHQCGHQSHSHVVRDLRRKWRPNKVTAVMDTGEDGAVLQGCMGAIGILRQKPAPMKSIPSDF
jgi:hypothetical protein